jgi:pyruvate/2-oxoacid:ferredoxin oxidoreductase beta subunit
MSYIDIIADAPDLATPGMSACQGCGAEIILRRALKVAGSNSLLAIPPGCLAAAGVVGWNFDNGLKIPVHISLLDNTASFMAGVSHLYQRRDRSDVNIICLAGDGATADCGFQSLTGAAERGDKMLYICYDNEGYMNTGFQRSSTTSIGSRTTTTPVGSQQNGKLQQSKYMPFIMAMHDIKYTATASPAYMKDMIDKIAKGLAASKQGFAYLHIFSPCPTGWIYPPRHSIDVARKAVQSNAFPLFEVEDGVWKLTVNNKKVLPVREYLALSRKYAHLDNATVENYQKTIDARMDILGKLIRQ